MKCFLFIKLESESLHVPYVVLVMSLDGVENYCQDLLEALKTGQRSWHIPAWAPGSRLSTHASTPTHAFSGAPEPRVSPSAHPLFGKLGLEIKMAVR